ncbi:hypothetical protein [uncultured Draconibacterium sp.]|uniref:hypothetical protein n=1 Tax=uncultured Draconibacterium sp. TaxID=1573823 RepID=UPI0025D04E48|nr:hypothetical protein [uncultured Draconibacterium sp.]
MDIIIDGVKQDYDRQNAVGKLNYLHETSKNLGFNDFQCSKPNQNRHSGSWARHNLKRCLFSSVKNLRFNVKT